MLDGKQSDLCAGGWLAIWTQNQATNPTAADRLHERLQGVGKIFWKRFGNPGVVTFGFDPGTPRKVILFKTNSKRAVGTATGVEPFPAGLTIAIARKGFQPRDGESGRRINSSCRDKESRSHSDEVLASICFDVYAARVAPALFPGEQFQA